MIAALWGPEKSWKTTMALTFPKPIYHLDLDVGGFDRAAWRIDLADIISKPYPTPIQIEKLLGQQKNGLSVRFPKKVVGIKEVWQQIVIDFVAAVQNPELQTVVIDSATQLWTICLHPLTRVLMADLTWKPIGSIKVGEEVIGFDENQPIARGQHRKLRRAVVEDTFRVIGDSYLVGFGDNQTVIASSEHPWLQVDKKRARPDPTKTRWIRTDELQSSMKLKYLCEPWEYDQSREAGEISGLLDGEGSLDSYHINFTQRPGIVLDRYNELLRSKGYSVSEYEHSYGTKTLRVMGIGNQLRLLGSIRPLRLLAKAAKVWEGMETHNSAEVTSVTKLFPMELVNLQTSTGTFIAEGLITHNCHRGYLQDLQERQLFKYTHDKEGKTINGRSEENFSENDYRERLQPIEYAEPNDRMRTLIYTARSYGKNLVLTHYPRDVYAQRVTDKGIDDYKTGDVEPDGFKDTQKLVDIVIWVEQDKKDNSISAKITKCGLEGLGTSAVNLFLPTPSYDGIITLQKSMRGE